MKVTKAVITAASRNQRTLPLQTLVDRDGQTKAVLRIIVEEALRAGVEKICVVVVPGDEAAYEQAAGDYGSKLCFVPQPEPLGYGHAIYCAHEFVAGEPFLHMVGDHVYVAANASGTATAVSAAVDGVRGCAQELVEVARQHACAVSGVQPTRENLLPYFGTVGGQRVPGSSDLYQIERVVEKPTPTQAEQELMVPGLRAGYYLCFFGMHILTPTVMEILQERLESPQAEGHIQLSPVLDELAQRERYLAFEARGRRYPIDARYGLLTAQLALALSGQERDEVLAGLCELLAQHTAETARPKSNTNGSPTAETIAAGGQ